MAKVCTALFTFIGIAVMMLSGENPVNQADECIMVFNEIKPNRIAFLSIDDGPTPYTPAILDELKKSDVPAIFFLWGERIKNHAPMSHCWLRRIIEEGHYIGLHSMTHEFKNLYIGSDASSRFIYEMKCVHDLIRNITGHTTNLCRAPYGTMSGFTAAHHQAVKDGGYICVDWNIDPEDWDKSSAEKVFEQFVNQVKSLDFPPELMILLHDGEPHTIEALPLIINFLRENGYQIKKYEEGHEFSFQHFRL